jgi:signal transduction histidine kinase
VAADSPDESRRRREEARAWLAEYHLAVAENERRERQVAALYELWRSVPHTETGRLLQRVTERVVAALDAHTCSLLLRDRNGDTLRVAASVGLPQDVAESVEVLVGERIAGRVAATGQPVLLNQDPRTHPLLAQGPDGGQAKDIARRPEVDSALCAPLIGGADGEVLGVLCLSRFAPAAPFTEGDLRVVSLFAAQAGAVVAQKRTVEDLTRAAQDAAEMERQVGRHQSLITVGQMAATVAHELRNPLSSIKGAAQFLLREFDDCREDSPGQVARAATLRDFLSIVVDEVDGLGRLTTDLLEFARPASPRMALTHLDELMACEVAFLRRELSAIGVNEVREEYDAAAETDGAVICADRAQIGRALRNLLLNAAQAAAGHHGTSGRPQVTVSLTRAAAAADANGWMIAVADNGPGVPEHLREKLWEPFFTTKARGTGLGLAQVRQVVEAHGGWAAVETADPVTGGARFTLYLPDGDLEIE